MFIKQLSARFSDNQIELSMEILLSISLPRALYLVDLVRDKRRFLQGWGRPRGQRPSSIGQKFMMDCVQSRLELVLVGGTDVWKWRSGYSLMQNMGKVRKKHCAGEHYILIGFQSLHFHFYHLHHPRHLFIK